VMVRVSSVMRMALLNRSVVHRDLLSTGLTVMGVHPYSSDERKSRQDPCDQAQQDESTPQSLHLDILRRQNEPVK
jgi:hypothetical protein